MERIRLKKSGRGGPRPNSGGPRPNSGGRRPGTGGLQNPPGGRPTSLTFMTAQQLREWALRSGEMPHVFLLRISRGETIEGHKPDFATRVEAAKACAPYFVPRLRLMEISEAERDPAPPREQLVFDESHLENLSVEELNLFSKMFKKLSGKKVVEPKPEPEVRRANRFTQALSRDPEDLD